MREFLKWSNPCGNCEHVLLDHMKAVGPIRKIDANKIPVSLNKKFVKCDYCKCKEWVPKDNLDRIEFLAEKRNLIK